MSGQRKISAKEIAAVVHDVRQMLAVITGRTGLLTRGADVKLSQDNLSAIAAATEQANAILSRLLKTPNHGSSGSCDIYHTLFQSSELMRPEPGISWLRGDHPPGADNGVWHLGGNLQRGCFTTIPQTILLEVLNNLLLNSLGAMPGGGRMLADVERIGENWCLRLQDSGPGIPESRREKIFELGFSSSGDPNRGIGLFSGQDLLARHGGSLKLAAETLSGACFELLLPFTSEKPDPPMELDPVQEVLYQPAVLVVDDDQAVREMLEDVLVELGCRVKVARDAPAATEIFPTESFEVVIIDQTLPGISGLEFAKGLRKQDPNLVLVLISGWGQEEILDKARGSVVDLIGEKPITLDKIVEILNQAGALRRGRLHGS